MDIEQARTKLAAVSSGTATKHPKVLVSELCVVMKFILDELDRIKSPPLTLFTKRPQNDSENVIQPKIQPPWPDKPDPRSPTLNPDIAPTIPPERRSGNAGDAK